MIGFASHRALEWIPASVRRQPVKAAALSVLGATMGGLWAHSLWQGPRPTSAAPVPVAATTAAKAVRSAAPGAQRALGEWLKRPIPTVTRDLFALPVPKTPADNAGASAEAGFWEELEKSMDSRADQEMARRVRMESLRTEAARLRLQSTVMSNGAPKALVNGLLVGEGDTVDGFRVAGIEPKRIIVERDGVRLEVFFNSER